jgi:uncharacterized protein (TIGR03083 family)
MEIAAHIDALRTEGERMAAAAATASPGEPVPTCPEWTVRDLVQHMGGVHRWATGYVAEALRTQWDVDLIDVVGTWPDDRDLVPWFRAGYTGLADALEAAPADLDCWTFLPAPSPRAMWARRQAHETAIHRVDAELATRDNASLSPFDPVFAADGVDELLSCFLPRPGTRLRSDPPTTLGVSCTDSDAGWLVHIGPDGVSATTVREAAVSDGDPACAIRATAADLYLVLWNRRSPGVLEISGSDAVMQLFLEKVDIRWA